MKIVRDMITKKHIQKQIVVYASFAFILVIAMIWLDEIFDLPHYLFGAEKTPVNWMESLFESVMILMLWFFSVFSICNFMRRIKYLEGFLPVCSFCKKIRIGDQWIPFEKYISEHSETQFTHSFCPDCAEKHYKEYFDTEEKKEL
jgi:hypothetical protein